MTEAHAIDRHALERLLEEFELLGMNEHSVDRILALVRPVEGTVSEDAHRLLQRAYDVLRDERDALAARLEAVSDTRTGGVA